jgi:hypothetical protein
MTRRDGQGGAPDEPSLRQSWSPLSLLKKPLCTAPRSRLRRTTWLCAQNGDHPIRRLFSQNHYRPRRKRVRVQHSFRAGNRAGQFFQRHTPERHRRKRAVVFPLHPGRERRDQPRLHRENRRMVEIPWTEMTRHIPAVNRRQEAPTSGASPFLSRRLPYPPSAINKKKSHLYRTSSS